MLGQIVDWFYGQIVGFLGNFFSEMGNMGAELFAMNWVQSVVLFFSYLGWALFAIGLVVACFECGVEYSGGRGNVKETALNAIKGFLAVSLFTQVPVRLYELAVSLQADLTAGKIQLFEDKRIRTAWDEEKEEWYFSIVDVVAMLTEQPDYQAARNYWKVTKKRLKDEGNETVTSCNQLKMTASDGKKRLTDVADTEQLLRIIQSIPSPKAEPFKLWLAQVGRERIEETIDPELTIERALETYLKKGYTREWINQRLQAIQVRKELTNEWDARGVQKGVEYAILTDEISRAWSGMSTRQYKNLKGLKKENLRDNMTTLELVLNMLAEATTTEISKQKAPETFSENLAVAREGGEAAGIARKAVEERTGVPVITAKNAAQLNQVVTDLLEGATTSPEKQDKRH